MAGVDALRSHLGALFAGMATGLSPDTQLLEGEAVVVRSPQGPLAGWWASARNAGSALAFSRRHHPVSGVHGVTFPDLTGRPPTTSIGFG